MPKAAVGERLPSLWLAAAILCGALALRVTRLGDQPLWIDEAFSLWFARQPFDYLWSVAPTFEPHPPLYYSLLRAWRVFGESEAALRSLSVLFSMGAILLVWAGARELMGGAAGRGKVALLAAALAALSPMQIFYAQEARPYAGLSFAVALMIYAGAKIAARRGGGAGPPGSMAMRSGMVAAASALTAWFQYVGLFYCFVFGLFILFHWAVAERFAKGYLLAALAAGALALLAISPQIPWLLARGGDWNASTWVPAPTVESVTAAAVDLFGARTTLFGINVDIFILLALAALAAAGAVRLWRSGRRSQCALLLLLAFGPILLVLGVTLAGLNILVHRALIGSSLPFYMLVAIGFASLPTRVLRTVAAGGALALFLSSSLTHSVGRYREPWREIAAYVAKRSAPGDLILIMPNEAAVPFQTYHSPLADDAPVLVVPAPYPAPGLEAPYPAGLAAVPGVTLDVAAAAARAADRRPNGSVFLVSRNRILFDPDDQLGAALAAGRPLVGTETWWGFIEVREFGLPRSDPR